MMTLRHQPEQKIVACIRRFVYGGCHILLVSSMRCKVVGGRAIPMTVLESTLLRISKWSTTLFDANGAFFLGCTKYAQNLWIAGLLNSQAGQQSKM
eukprot:1422987-Pleurochrysis_carterae.AAC.2